jgi:hypothetical protein
VDEIPDPQGKGEEGLTWLALAVTIIVLGLIIGLVLLFKLNLFEGGTSPPLPLT